MDKPALPFWDAALSREERIGDLMSRLTLTEKIGQMLFCAPAIERLGIPEYNWWNECLHGVGRAGLATVFPQAIGLASMWDDALMLRVATSISDEARAKHHENLRRDDHDIYHGLTYWSPNINIFRDPRWGRGHETYGECPYLTGRMGVAFCKGLQGDDDTYLKLVATPKHYAVHSGPEGLRHHFNAEASQKDLWETYLPAFHDCIVEAGAFSIMGAYNRTNGEVCCASPTLLTQILRETWGFEGYVVSDCGAIADFHTNHKVTETPEESAALAIKEGCDLNCGRIFDAAAKAVAMGLITEEDVDTCLRRLLDARFRLGMFDPPEQVPYASIPYEVVDCEEHRALALEAAQASIVLLKNEGNLLPLRKDLDAVAVIGPNADDRSVLLGNYAGTASRYTTAIEGIRAAVSEKTQVLYSWGCDHFGHEARALGKATRGVAEAVATAERADVVIMVMGLCPALEGEQGDAMNSDAAGDRNKISLTGAQNALLAALHATGKPIVLVNISGSAVAIPWAQDHIPAIVQQFYSGQAGGTALASVLFGDHNPSGRLPVTFYRSLEDLPPFEDYDMAGRTYRYFEDEPLYPFGFGLSYTQFSYSALEVPKEAVVGQPLDVSLTVKNMGQTAGHEVVQIYMHHDHLKVRMPVRQLVGFRRVWLEPGKSEKVTFHLEPEQFMYVAEDGTSHAAPGTVMLNAGGSQPDAVSKRLGAPETLDAVVKLT